MLCGHPEPDKRVREITGEGAVWLVDGPAATLSRIDIVTGKTTTYPMAGPVVDVAIDRTPSVVGPARGLE